MYISTKQPIHARVPAGCIVSEKNLAVADTLIDLNAWRVIHISLCPIQFNHTVLISSCITIYGLRSHRAFLAINLSY